MSTKRRKFAATEKAKIALEAIKGDSTMAEIVTKYKVHATQVNHWKRQALEHLPESFTNKAKEIKTDYESQLAELYQQIGRLKVENDFLKKSLSCSIIDKRSLLEPSHPELSMRWQCEVFGINRSSLYCKSNGTSRLSDEKLALLRLTDEVYTKSLVSG